MADAPPLPADGGPPLAFPLPLEGGLGIGLAPARRLAELHGGHMRAESAGPGRGASFSVALPRRGRPDAAARAPAPHHPTGA
jgi:signal transduction histidine kinase